MSKTDITLHDRFDLEKKTILLNGTQALVRLMMMQKERDRRAGLNTAGYVSGYRGSPLGAVDMQMTRAQKQLQASDVTFQEGINEDLAATAVWGTQQAEMRGEGKYDGVFSLWYGKGPGIDRSGDVMRHANMAGTSAHGGVLMAMGDDHTGESSTVCHQSDFALVDAYMPILSPAGVQEILDYGQYGFALSRFSGCWSGLKVMKDTIEVTSVVDASLARMNFVTPEFDMPEGGLNIRAVDHWIEQEVRLQKHKRFAAEAFAHANKIDNRVWGKPGAKIGLVAAGKNWLDLNHALSLIGLDAAEAERLGVTTYKIGQVWPLDMRGFQDWAEGLDLIIVVEEKRKLIEVQIKEALFDNRQGRRVYGATKGEFGTDLFKSHGALDPVEIAELLGEILIEEGRDTDRIRAGLAQISEARRSDNAEEIAVRQPWFCAGCPHNTSTKLPDGSRGYAGIGCHIMALWMDRDTSGFTHMGAEGVNWVGEAPFSKRDHVFQNLGDGTYNHSGLMAIRFALMANTNITYKILYNDAVAMTGGQPHEGGLSADRIMNEVIAMGVKNVFLVYDEKEDVDLSLFPSHVPVHPRDELPLVQDKCRDIKGVSAIIYIQTCAAEKRRRRKKGTFPDPDKRVFINTDICEGCGDCGVQSNCVAIVPVDTEFGRKRAIDQSSCNKDFSCVKGFCPSFVTMEGAKIRKKSAADFELPALPMPKLPEINGTHNVVITGVGGTGVVTIGAILAMAAHLDDKGAGVMEMAGLAQKGGAVHIHCRLANRPEDINAIRVATGECDALIGGDLVVSAGAKTLGLMATGRTKAAVNSHETMTGQFAIDRDFTIPHDRLGLALEARLRENVTLFDATGLAANVMGDSIYSNMIMFGAAWQMGSIPVTLDAIREAIKMNGAKPDMNLRAFDIGRWAIAHPEDAARSIAPVEPVALPKTLEQKIDMRADHLAMYQSDRLGRKYREFVAKFDDIDMKEAVSNSYHKLLAYKDEYEVARLMLDSRKKAEATFDGDIKMTYHLAPPMISRKGKNGVPVKREFGAGLERFLPLLAKMKRLRGTPLDVFGKTAERRMERDLIKQYERDLAPLANITPDQKDAAMALARLPMDIRGFGHVKEEAATKAAKRREELLAALKMSPDNHTQAAQ
ncbi:indolepyruvate ferredoxin oxidoreductase family protein [Aestuariibius sp. HNIBRBA575]|uniref:indolepyruvate ferredoxin oxidoreductase family protein n=1 Tax=Aestuariibius sp. HNIBRBA575 TaxID=3233343 RepID=UPI0034A34374